MSPLPKPEVELVWLLPSQMTKIDMITGVQAVVGVQTWAGYTEGTGYW
jgi:hypothetical protein